MPQEYKKTCRTCGGQTEVRAALPEVEEELTQLRQEREQLEEKLLRVLLRIERLEDVQRRATLGT